MMRWTLLLLLILATSGCLAEELWEATVSEHHGYIHVNAPDTAVEEGIAVFEEEFLAYIVLADGNTVAKVAIPQLGTQQPLLLGR